MSVLAGHHHCCPDADDHVAVSARNVRVQRRGRPVHHNLLLSRRGVGRAHSVWGDSDGFVVDAETNGHQLQIAPRQ